MNDHTQIPASLTSGAQAEFIRPHRSATDALSRDHMQIEALIIESLLKTTLAVLSSNDSSDAFELVDMAGTHAEKLNCALDSLYTSEAVA